ncbi:MAG: rod shape-determining protein MreB, partial [Oscillospiraceae bacterium]|nr:rod shape-determining protein MreB [Oscillospiraceae bacterium]
MFTKDIGIDLGTANTLVYMRGKGIVLREPSVVAVHTRTEKARYVGKDAKQIIGRTPGSIVAVRPLKEGVIADFDLTVTMLQEFIHKALKGHIFTKARVIICIPSGVTSVERNAVREATESAGVKQVFIIEEPMAAAIGAGLPTIEPTGSMIVDIGGGTTDVAVISLGGSVVSSSLKVAGDKFDEAIVKYVKRKHNVII